MQQPSVADYFKVKKRTREEPLKLKKSIKSVAITADSGKKSPNRINAVSDASSPDLSPSPAKYFSPIRQKDIFSSPVKLSEIKSPVKKSPALSSSKSAVKRLFFDSGSDSESLSGLKARKVPAFERLSHLAQKTVEELEAAPAEGPSIPFSSTAVSGSSSSEAASTLPLPLKYNTLLELFSAVETAASLLHNRKEVITFLKLRPSVHELMRKFALTERHLGQMLHVFPDCYKLTQENMKTGPNQYSYQLCLSFNLAATENISPKLTSSVITERRRIFHRNLINICHEYHKEFLLTIDPPIVIPEGKKVTRWHPKFRLDDVLDIPRGAVPAPPESNKMSNMTARDMMARAQEILQNSNPRMKKAVDELQRKTEESQKIVSAEKNRSAADFSDAQPQLAASAAGLRIAESSADRVAAAKLSIAKAQEALLRRAKNDPKKAKKLQDILSKRCAPADPSNESISKVNVLPSPAEVSATLTAELPANKVQTTAVDKNKKNAFGALKGISQSLLEKIRAREQEKSIKAMTLTPLEIKRQAMLGRLPEFVKIIRNAMVAERKATMPLRVIIDRICHSQRGSMREVEGEGHVRLLADLLPEWITLLKTSQGEYLKIDKNLEINDLILKLKDISRRAP